MVDWNIMIGMGCHKVSWWGWDATVGTHQAGTCTQTHPHCIPYFAGSLQNRLERKRGQGLRCVLRQEVGVSGAGWGRGGNVGSEQSWVL